MIHAYTIYGGNLGWANHARQFFSALSKLEPVTVWPHIPTNENSPPIVLGLTDQMSDSSKEYGIVLGQIDHLPQAASQLRQAIRVAFVVWEGTRIARDVLKALETMDQIWTPSYWGRKILVENGIAFEKLHVVPGGVDVELFSPQKIADKSCYRFLSVGKWEERKNTDGLVRAFATEFEPDEPVELVLHCTNQLHTFDQRMRIERLTRGRHAPIILSKEVPYHQMSSVYNRCDAFVLPTRAEGWGLPIMEAMACSLPVIVTQYSAPLDYLTPESSYLLSVRDMPTIDDPLYYPLNSGVWAEPCLSDLKRLMRHVFEHRDEARHKGSEARRTVVSGWTWRDAAIKASSLLS